MSSNLAPYRELLDAFSTNEINASQFETRFLKRFKNDPTDWSEAEFAILQELFASVDAFCPDPSLREEDDLDENQLRNACELAAVRLNALINDCDHSSDRSAFEQPEG